MNRIFTTSVGAAAAAGMLAACLSTTTNGSAASDRSSPADRCPAAGHRVAVAASTDPLPPITHSRQTAPSTASSHQPGQVEKIPDAKAWWDNPEQAADDTESFFQQPASTPKATDNAVVVGESQIAVNNDSGFAISAFPPTIPDQEWHQDAWIADDCLRCHETGVADAPMVRHRGLPAIALESKCRSCHVLVPGKTESRPHVSEAVQAGFLANAFPPMIPNSESHIAVWGDLNCLACHKKGKKGATKVVHKGMPAILLEAKCRTCHVQIRSNETSPWDDE